MRALLLLRRPPRWNKHSAARMTWHVTTRTTHHSCRVVTCHDTTSGIWVLAEC